jgi:hypothetical protein
MNETETTPATEECAQDPLCARCQEAPCLCEYLPPGWEQSAHGSYKVYARKQITRNCSPDC